MFQQRQPRSSSRRQVGAGGRTNAAPTMCNIDTMMCTGNVKQIMASESPRTLPFNNNNNSPNKNAHEPRSFFAQPSKDDDDEDVVEVGTFDTNWTPEEDMNSVLGKNHHYRPSEHEEKLHGKISDIRKLPSFIRPARNQTTYQEDWMWPMPIWWCIGSGGPLWSWRLVQSWLPIYNMEFVPFLCLWNLIWVLVAGLTNICGDHDEYTSSKFCHDGEWFLYSGTWLYVWGTILLTMLLTSLVMAVLQYRTCRRDWQSLESAVTNLVRQVCFHSNNQSINNTNTNNDKGAWERRRVVGMCIAIPYCVKLHLRKEMSALADLGNILVYQDILNLQRSRMKPQFCLDMVTHYFVTKLDESIGVESKSNEKQSFSTDSKLSFTEGRLSAATQSAMTDITKAMGNLIHPSSPIPANLSALMRFAIVVFLVFYPLHMVVHYGYFTLLLAPLLNLLVLGLESIVSELIHPFDYERSALDLDKYCKTLSKDCNEILVRIEHEQSNQLFDPWTVSKMNEEMIYEASDDELRLLTANQRVQKQGRAQFVRTATMGFTLAYDKGGNSDTDTNGGGGATLGDSRDNSVMAGEP